MLRNPYEETSLRKGERNMLRPIIGAVLAAFLALLLVFVASQAYAEEVPVHVHESGGTTIQLMPGPCVHPGIKEFLDVGMPHHKFKAIASNWRMADGTHKPFVGCWAELTAEEVGEPAFMLLFEDGERYLVPRDEFLQKPGQVGA